MKFEITIQKVPVESDQPKFQERLHVSIIHMDAPLYAPPASGILMFQPQLGGPHSVHTQYTYCTQSELLNGVDMEDSAVIRNFFDDIAKIIGNRMFPVVIRPPQCQEQSAPAETINEFLTHKEC